MSEKPLATRDGVPISQGMIVWSLRPDGRIIKGRVDVRILGPDWQQFVLSSCYAERSEAEKGREMPLEKKQPTLPPEPAP